MYKVRKEGGSMREFILVLSLASTVCAIFAKYIVRPYIQNDREKTKITLDRVAQLSSDVDSLRVELHNLTESVSRLHSLLCAKSLEFKSNAAFSEKKKIVV